MEDLREGARQFGIELTDDQLERFGIYLNELNEWNEEYNLTSITKPSEIIIKHFLDSLSAAQALPHGTQKVIDIGAGAGFPGIPLKMAFPDLQITLIDAAGKKVTFLKHMITELGLKNIEAIHARAEDLGRDPQYRESFDVAVARAVAELRILAEYALPFIKVGGILIAQKIVTQTEVDAAKTALVELGARITAVTEVKLPELGIRHLITVTKTSPTPAEFPRRPGMPSKNPL